VDLKLQRIGAWGGIAMLLLLGLFFMVIGGLIPPLSPTASAQEITQFFIDNKLRVRLGIALTSVGACVALPFFAVISLRLRRVEGKWGMLSVTWIFANVAFVPGFWFMLMLLGAAAYRPEHRPPEITLAISDVFWLMFVGIVGAGIAQGILVAIAAFIDRSEAPTFPRWYGYFNVWYVLLAAPGGAVVIFNDGPLAWNGVFAFWIPLAVFAAWMIVTSVVVLRAITAQEDAERLATADS
jgi:MFS family permease